MQLPERLRPLFEAFGEVNKKAYASPLLQSNFVLSKVPAEADVFAAYCNGTTHAQPTLFEILTQICRYYAVNIAAWCVFACTTAVYRTVGPTDTFPAKACTVLDSYIIIPKVLSSGAYADSYFPGLAEVLRNKSRDAVFFPRIFGSRNPWHILKALRIAASSVAILTEYSLLSARDCLTILYDVLRMPWAVIRLIHSLPDTKEHRTIKLLLIRGLSRGHVPPIIRRKAASRLGKILPQGSRTISWFENQAIDKVFFAGVHETAPHIERYAAQLLIWPDTLLNSHPDNSEIPFGLTPNRTVVNGTYFLPETNGQTYRVGPALRYQHLYTETATYNEHGHILVLLSYLHDETVQILQAVKPLAGAGASLVFRFHPATKTALYAALLPENATLSTTNFCSALNGASLAIGSGTGTLAEAVALGIPAVSLTNSNGYSHTYLPPFGKGILWESCENTEELPDILKILASACTLSHRQELCRQFRRMLFNEPTSDTIIAAFDL